MDGRCKGRLILKDYADSLTSTPPKDTTKIRQSTHTKAMSQQKITQCSQLA
jgi:hypothetical protein